MAGAEKTGVAAASADLFQDAVCIVTPTRKTDPTALRKVKQLWRAVGGRVLTMAPEFHDRLVSRSSHLPHLVAAALATHVLDPQQPEEQAGVCANGFRDATRIASGSPEMWRDIALANRAQVRVALDGFVRRLQRVQAILRAGDVTEVTRFFEIAKARRDQWCASGSSASQE
jgi:prephenate dehydrogenase